MKASSRLRAACGMALTAFVASGANTVWAADAAKPTTETGLETIIVTAQKAAENVQTVPISVSAVTGAAIETAHTINLEAMTGAVPNVQIGHFSNTPTGAVFSIRGMGVIEPDPYAGQTVTVVVDGIPQVFNMTSLVDLFDIERIEVLRGPQGTLFGANTTGGVVNIVTRQPTGQDGVRAQVSVGNYDRLDANMAIDFPITSTLAGKISATHHSESGWTTNVVDGSSMGDQNITALRGYLKWTPSDTFDATLIQEVDRGRNGSPIVIQGGLPGEAEYVPPGTQFPGQWRGQYPSPCMPGGNPCHAPDKYYSANNSVPDKDDYNIYATTLTMNWESGIGDLVSITGYKRFNEDNYTDQDGTVVWTDDTHRVTHGYQVTQELRDTINPTDSIRLILGGFASYDYYHHLQNFRIEGFAHGIRQPSTQDQIRRSYSLFGQGFFNLTDKLRLQAGVRGTKEKTRMIATLDTCANLQFDESGNVVGMGDAVFTGDTCGLGGFTAKGEDTWNNVGGKIGLDYQVTDTFMVYGYIAHGFKSGGFTGRLAIPEDIGPYDPEKVNTLEVGLKADWFDNRLRTNLALFFNKYKDLQLAQIYFTNDDPPKQGNTILNAADAETKGAELEITAVPVERLNINFAIAYLNAEYTKFDYQLPGGEGDVIDLKGEDLQNAPEITGSAGINYEFQVGAGYLGFGLQDRYTGSKYFTSLLNTPRSKIQSTNYIDANVDWRPSDDSKFDVSFWVRNLADKRYIASVFDAPGTLGLVNYMPPREFGMTINYKY